MLVSCSFEIELRMGKISGYCPGARLSGHADGDECSVSAMARTHSYVLGFSEVSESPISRCNFIKRGSVRRASSRKSV